MRILFLDIASHHGLLALCTEQEVIASKPLDHRIRDDELVKCFEELWCRGCAVRPPAECLLRGRLISTPAPPTRTRHQHAGATIGCDLTHVACIVGPGGFTSLRVGVAFANAMSWSLGIPVAGIHLSDLYAPRVTPNACVIPSVVEGDTIKNERDGSTTLTMTRSFFWIQSTKKNEVFVRGGRWENPTHVRIEDIPDQIQWAGELLPEHRRDGWVELPLKPLEQILPGFLAKLKYSNDILKPWYGRNG